jgi:hypothetical protein
MAPKKNTAPKTVRGVPVSPTKTTKPSGGTSTNTKAKIDALSGLTESLGGLADLVKLLGESDGSTSGGAFAGYSSDAEYAGSDRTGTSNTGKRYINGQLVTEDEWNKFLYGDSNKGGAGGAGATGTSSAAEEAEKKRREGQSAYNLLFEQFNQYGLGALVEPLKGFIVEGLSPAEFTLRLRETDAYKKRFAANQSRIQKGLRALSEAEYIELEDQYQNVMRNYGLPATYYQRGDMGRQEGFEKFIAGDVSAAELEDRIQTAQNRVINAAPEVAASLKSFYPDITNGDILAYALDPEQAITNIKRKVTAAEIGAGALMSGLATGVTRAEELAKYGVTGESYRQAAPTIRQATERGSQLASFFGETPYTQQTAESMALNVGDAASAIERTRKLTEKERALYSGTSGIAQGALARDRAGAF